MPSVTLTSLTTKIRKCGDFRSPQFTDATIEDLINLYIEEYWNLVLDNGGESRIVKFSSDLTVSSGTDTVSLPSDFLILCGVEVKDDASANTCYVTMSQADIRKRNQYGNVVDKLDTQFLFIDEKLYLRPVPNWSGYIRVLYVPEPTFYDSDGDPAVTSFTFINGGQQFVMWSVAEHCAGHRGESTSFYGRKVQMAEKKLIRALEARRTDPSAVTDEGISEDYRILYPQMRGYQT